MRRVAFVAVGLAILGLVVAAQQRPAPAPRSPIEGVWRAVEQTINDRTLKDATLGAGFHIYTAHHFAAVRESGQPPRPAIPDVDSATGAQLLAMWGPFVAQFGTYEISGDRMTHTVLVAKNPGNMNQTSVNRFKVEGNTLTISGLERRPGERFIVVKMIRVE